MSVYPFGEDTIMVPAQFERPRDRGALWAVSRLEPIIGRRSMAEAKASLQCDGPHSDCHGRGRRGVFPDPSESAAQLCPDCFFKLMQRRGARDETER